MSAETDRQINQWFKEVRKGVAQFEKRDKKNILVKGSKPVWLDAITRTPKRKSSRLNARYARLNGKRKAAPGKGRPLAFYAPGNLRDSISILTFRRSTDVFVGPYIKSRKRAMIRGNKKYVGDGYYAQMVFGSAKRFRNRVLVPAALSKAGQLRSIVLKEVREKIIKRTGKG